ncbi:hypothetical protein RND81_14G156500 [Saponaria officinalis]|uniref:Secreted protein n=1 Tax=Saponaria officinalis TaxID=3572 RepID=A0AAW1GYC6_SAPOF
MKAKCLIVFVLTYFRVMWTLTLKEINDPHKVVSRQELYVVPSTPRNNLVRCLIQRATFPSLKVLSLV